MGIVVTIFMLLGLLGILPFSTLNCRGWKSNTQYIYFITVGVLVAGLWNALWFGLRHLGSVDAS